MKKFRKEITHAIRDLDRINRKREMETVTLRADMAKSLKMNNEAVVRIKAKTLVNHKKSITRMLTLRSQMQAREGSGCVEREQAATMRSVGIGFAHRAAERRG